MTHPRRHPPSADRQPSPPTDLPLDPRAFYHAAINPGEPPEAARNLDPALRRLGPLALPGCRFPLMGFLATVYEQAAGHARGLAGDKPPPDAWPDPPDAGGAG